jgi:hypothetical protein
MSARAIGLICFVCVLLSAASAPAQEGHPAKGTWVGHWGPTLTVQSRIVVVIDHDGKTMSGVLNPGPNAVPLKAARLDITPGQPSPGKGISPILPIFKVSFEADARDAKGTPVAIVAEGTMHAVALYNRWIEGTWTQTSGGKTVKSEFKIARQ